MKEYETVDEYLNNFSGEALDKLSTMRQLIKEEVPEAKEKISYGIPTFTIGGKYFMYIAGYQNHVSIHPLPKDDKKLDGDIKPFVAGKGTIRFPLDKPLPLDLIRRIAKNLERRRIES